MKDGKIGFTIVEVSLIIIVIVITVAIAFPHLFSAKGEVRKSRCRNHQHEISYAIRECTIKYPESPQDLLGLRNNAMCDYLIEKGVVKDASIFRCPANTSDTDVADDYKVLFSREGTLVAVECTVNSSHNRP
jgi:competence protein ComGC